MGYKRVTHTSFTDAVQYIEGSKHNPNLLVGTKSEMGNSILIWVGSSRAGELRYYVAETLCTHLDLEVVEPVYKITKLPVDSRGAHHLSDHKKIAKEKRDQEVTRLKEQIESAKQEWVDDWGGLFDE